ncbi:MAG: dihydroorotase [Marinilabiliales bacterium]
MKKFDYILQDVTYINESSQKSGNIYIKDGKIERISEKPINATGKFINTKGLILLPGVIDDQVHFREPGLTYKGDICSESRAAIAGGVTSYMEMPNTNPQTTTIQDLLEKHKLASETSFANFSFYLGATNDNINEILKADPSLVCGIKVFMGSSTGNMLVNNKEILSVIFKNSPILIVTHCEEDTIINNNLDYFKKKYGDDIPFSLHPVIRSEEACYASSSVAVELAEKYNARLHILHLSTAKELTLLTNKHLKEKKITAEVCVHHLWFTNEDYDKKGAFIKWNPAIKTKNDRDALRDAVKNNLIDIVATDHAPHTISEKLNKYLKAPSGGPLVQHSLTAMLELFHQGVFSLEEVVNKMCHQPAELFQIDNRGYIREGYWADLVLVNLNNPWTVKESNILYKCKWSPFEGQQFRSKVIHTFVNGKHIYNNGVINDSFRGMALKFRR